MPDAYTQIPLGIKAPDLSMPAGGGTLGSMLDLQNKQLQQQQTAQSIQTGALEQQRVGTQLSQEQQDLAERNRVNDITKRLQTDYMDPQTRQLDYNKLIPDVMTAAPKMGPGYIQNLAVMQKDAADTHKAINELDQQGREYTANFLYSLKGLPKEQINSQLNFWAQNNPAMAKPAQFFGNVISSAAAGTNGDQKAIDAAIDRAAQGVKGAHEQQQMQTPEGTPVNTGQKTYVVSTKPGSSVPVGQIIPGTMAQQELPPTTQVYNTQTNQPSYLGPTGPETQPPGAPGAAPPVHPLLAQARGAGLAAGPNPTTTNTIANSNTDWLQTQQNASGASQDISVLQNIKKYAHGAALGPGAEREAWLAGVADKLGMSVATLKKTDTDLLAKNSNMLALAGGDTNFARTLAEGANPNIHMNEAAITKAADQVISQKQMQLNKQQYMQQFTNNPAAYQSELAAWNQNADPRVLQFRNMDKADRVQMIQNMSPQEQARFRQALAYHHGKGFVQ